MLTVEGLIQFYGKPLLYLFYIPFTVFISARFPPKIILSCLAAIFLLGLPALWQTEGHAATSLTSLLAIIDSRLAGWIYLSILITAIISYYFFYKEKKISRKAVKDFEGLKNSALNLEASTQSSPFDEDRFSHLVKSILETKEELNAVIKLTKKVIKADSATLFIFEGDNLVLKASTEDIGSGLTYTEKGYLSGLIKEKKPIIQPKPRGSSFGLRPPRTKEIGSFLCVPVLDGDVPLGALVMDSYSESAFAENEKNIAVEFALQTKQILKRTRIYVEVERVTKGLKALDEASRALISSLEVEKIAEEFVELVSGMVSSPAVGFFITDKGKLRLIAKKGFEPEKETFYTKGTYFNLIVKNKEPLHFSHLDKKREVYPFKTSDTRTFLGIPIILETEVLGVLAVTSREPDAISSFQVNLLKTVTDLAAMAITNAQLHNQVEKLAVTDGLTGLYNHKHFQERLNEEFQRIKRLPQSLSLMLIDIDHFKKINDAYGHPAGDTVLSKIALILKKTLRGIDILARYGGEEFVAVLIGTGSSGAKKMAERIRNSVMNNPFYIDENKIMITLSIGVATHPQDATNKTELIDKADQALYYAKQNGRNQVCEWKDVVKKNSY